MTVEQAPDSTPKRKRTQRNFPASTFEEPLEFTKVIHEFGAGQPVRRLSLFDHLGKSPESGSSRQLITNAGRYGLIRGSYAAEQLELTQDGVKAVDDRGSPRELARARVRLAIENIEPFKGLFDRFKGNRLPAKAALIDAIQEFGVEKTAAEEAVDTFIVNLRFLGLLKTLSGAERIVTLDHLLDTLPSSDDLKQELETSSTIKIKTGTNIVTAAHAEFERTAFFVAPIGAPDSEARKHSDLFLSTLIEPALEQFKLEVVRADEISQPGIITRQIMEYLIKSRLVIADLSYHNPNVFYEIARRLYT